MKKSGVLTFSTLLMLLFTASFLCIFFPQTSKAEEQIDAEKILMNQDKNNFTKEFQNGVPALKKDYIYEIPTLKTLAHLHWALSMLDINDDVNIDDFLKITECEIYKNYMAQEFEWGKIRNATREFITKNRADFPVRYELVIPLRLRDYDAKRSAFEINKQDQINSVRLFEMMPKYSNYSRVCNISNMRITNYVEGLAVELSRPFSLVYVPVENATAQAYIAEKNALYEEKRKTLSNKRFNLEYLYDMRLVYLVMNVRIFTYKGPYVRNVMENLNLAQVLAVLESYEIYQDVQRKKLLYSRSYVTKRDEIKESENLKNEIDLIKQKMKGKGIFF